MSDTAAVQAIEQKFFTALVEPNLPALEEILADDLTMAALNGSLLDKASLLEAIKAGHLRFQDVRLIESAVRFYPPLAIVVGRTEMSGTVAGSPFTASSRYTHVYSQQNGQYQLIAAQGTPILAQ